MTTTVNYSWALPTVGASVNTWGTLVNNILIDIDANMFARTGGTISGNVSVTGALSAIRFVANGTVDAASVNLGTFGSAASLNTPSGTTGNLSVNGTPALAWSATGVAVEGTLTATVPDTSSAFKSIAASGRMRIRPYVDGTYGTVIDATNTAESAYQPLSLTGSTVSLRVTSGDGLTVDASGNLLPGANGTQEFGSTSLRWSQVWCTAGAFNTSDATLKTPIRTMQAKELAAGYQMAQELGTFQWLESVKEKGDKARRHVGLTVQRAAEIMESHRLDPWGYGFMGYDKWEAVTEIVDATEDDDGAYQEQVTRQKTVRQTSQKQTVEIVNGKPVLKVETVESDVPITEQIQVVDADGKPVFIDVQEVPAVLDEEGNVVTPVVPAHQVPMLHAVPVMETVTVWKRVKEMRPAGESYAFRSDQLAFFIAAGVAAKARA